MADNKKYAVIIINSNAHKEQRVIKTIEALKISGIVPILFSNTESYDGCICYGLPTIVRKATHLDLPLPIRKLYSLRYRYMIWKSQLFNKWFYNDYRHIATLIRKELQPYEADTAVVIAHHMKNLPAGAILAKMIGKKLVFNAHEYYPEQFMEHDGWQKQRKVLNRIGHSFLNDCYKIFTVCRGILDRYQQVFGLDNDKQILVTNATKYYNLTPTSVGNKIKLIHHGIANRNRQLEMMIEVADHVDKDRFEFYYMLVPSPHDVAYFDYLKEEIEKKPNCFLLEPVSTTEIATKINQYDLGFYLYNNKENFNMQHYLPNKLYEFIQARLGVVIGPYVEMERIVNEYDIGVVAQENNTREVARILSAITKEDVFKYKNNTMKAAEALKGENEIQKMATVFSEIVN